MSDADAIRAIGLFDLHPTLAGLLEATAAFLRQHGVEAPLDLSTRFDSQRGWQASLTLDWADFARTFEGYPVPLEITPRTTEDGTVLDLVATMRAGQARTTLPLAAAAGTIDGGGLVLRQSPPT